MILTEQETIRLCEKVKTILSVGTHEVVFEKINGTIRSLKCTRDLDLLPKKENFKSETGKPGPRNSLYVFDVDLQQWRSFRFDKLISVNGLPAETLLVL